MSVGATALARSFLAMRLFNEFPVISLLFVFCSSVRIEEEKLKEKDEGQEIRKDSFCGPFPAIEFDRNEIGGFENGSLLHKGLVYPAGSYRVLGNETHGCVCNLRTCLRKCCPRNEILGATDRPNCTRPPNDQPARDLFLERHQLAVEVQPIFALTDRFFLLEDMACPENTFKYMLEPERYEEDGFVVQSNGTLRTASKKYPAWSYCLDWKESFDKIAVLVCVSAIVEELEEEEKQPDSYNIGIIVSIPFFFATFLVYAIIPELRNLYGKTLMCYVVCLVLAYTFLVVAKLSYIGFLLCSAIAFVIHFSFLASFFWLNVMCFDIWWTFGGFRSLQGSVKQRERKKFLIYSIYAWGCPSLLTGVCILMDSLRNVPEKFKPQFGVTSCWFSTETAKAIYFYGPMGLTVLCNVCLFVSTALKIVRHKKDTAHQLKGVDSRRHDDNKQWFNLYLKLFIVMGINWSMEIISWLCKDTPTYIWYLTDLANTLQGVIIFLIFVWKDKIRRLLLKRLGCHGRNFLSRTSTRSAYHSSASRTCTTSAVHLQEKVNPHTSEHSSSRGKPVFAESAAT